MNFDFKVDPELWAVYKAVVQQKDTLVDENAALRKRVAAMEDDARLMPHWRRRAKHAVKQLLAPKAGCNCTASPDPTGCSRCYTGPVTQL